MEARMEAEMEAKRKLERKQLFQYKKGLFGYGFRLEKCRNDGLAMRCNESLNRSNLGSGLWA